MHGWVQNIVQWLEKTINILICLADDGEIVGHCGTGGTDFPAPVPPL